MHFLLSSMSVVYVLPTFIPEDGENVIVDQIRRRNKWENDDFVCRDLILNGMSNPLFDIYHNVESSKELWVFLEAKYMAEHASSKNFLVSNFTKYKMSDSRPVMEQYNELHGMLDRFTQHKINMNEAIQVSCIIDELLPSWKDFKHTLKHQKEELTLIELGSHMYNDNKGKRKHQDTKYYPNKKSKVTCWKCGKPEQLKKDCKGGKIGKKASGSGTNSLDDDTAWWVDSGAITDVHFKRMKDMSKDALILAFDMDTEKWQLQDSLIQSQKLWVKEIECIFIGYAEYSKDFRTKDIGGSIVPEEVTEEKESINDEMDSIMGNNTCVLADLPAGCKPFCCKWIFKIKLKVDATIENFKARPVIQGYRQKSGIDYFDTYALVARISTIRLLIVLASIGNLIINRMDVKTTFLNGELDKEAYVNQPQGFIMPNNENKA
ncbi:zinc finger, CCHC-type containing protein [Tanacetum coccineum]